MPKARPAAAPRRRRRARRRLDRHRVPRPGRRDGVSEEVANRVRQISRELGYVANPYARTLAGGASSTSAWSCTSRRPVLLRDRRRRHQGRRRAAPAGADLPLRPRPRARAAPDPQPDRPAGRHHHRRRLRLQRRRGRGAGKAELSAFQAAGGRVAVIGRHSLGVDAVLPDNEAGGRRVGDHLLDLGHRHIASPPAPRPDHGRRPAGRGGRALDAAGLALDDLPVVQTDFTRDGGRVAAARSSTSTRRPPRSSRSTTPWRWACSSALRAPRHRGTRSGCRWSASTTSRWRRTWPRPHHRPAADDRHGPEALRAGAQAPPARPRRPRPAT